MACHGLIFRCKIPLRYKYLLTCFIWAMLMFKLKTYLRCFTCIPKGKCQIFKVTHTSHFMNKIFFYLLYSEPNALFNDYGHPTYDHWLSGRRQTRTSEGHRLPFIENGPNYNKESSNPLFMPTSTAYLLLFTSYYWIFWSFQNLSKYQFLLLPEIHCHL